jgi:uncharacterized protein (TIGR00290 family)
VRIALFWSGGKDAAWALHRLRQEGLEVTALVTTVVQGSGRVMVHEIRRDVVRQQAALLGLPLVEIGLPPQPSNALYEFAVLAALRDRRERGEITAIAAGDLYLADVREFREGVAARAGVKALFPLWGIRPDILAESMLAAGVRAHLVVVDGSRIDPNWAGNPWDRRWVDSLPSSIDPCGERGEFHTLISDGPMFPRPLEVQPLGASERDGYGYADFALAGTVY